MKWLMLISSVDAQDGGTATATLELATALAVEGHEVHLCTMAMDRREIHPAVMDAQTAGVNLHFAPVRHRTTFKYSPWLLSQAVRASSGTDVVTLHGFYQFTTVVALLISQMRRAPLLLEPHGVFEPYQEALGSRLKPLFMVLVGRWVLRRAQSVMVASHQEERGVRTSLGSRVPRVSIVGLGVRIPLQGASSNDFSKRSIMFLSRIAPKKRLDKTLDAVRLLAERGEPVHLTVCGEGDPEYIAQLRSIKVSPSDVSWVGHISGSRRREVEADQSLFVLPSDNENFGLAVVEAMAVGLPVITTTQTGSGEHVVAATAGWVLDKPTPEALATAIRHALSDPSELARRGRNGLVHAQKSLTWAHVAQRWVAAAADA